MSCPPLPVEIWHAILSYLEYTTLKQCERTSKTFRALITDDASKLDSTLFRSGRFPFCEIPVQPYVHEQFTLHPALESLYYDNYQETLFERLASRGERIDQDGNSLLKLSSFDFKPVLQELATIPPSQTIDVWIPPRPHQTVESSHGVTVEDVLRTFDDMMKSDIKCGYLWTAVIVISFNESEAEPGLGITFEKVDDEAHANLPVALRPLNTDISHLYS